MLTPIILLVTTSKALVTNSFLLLVVRHLLLEAMHLLLVKKMSFCFMKYIGCQCHLRVPSCTHAFSHWDAACVAVRWHGRMCSVPVGPQPTCTATKHQKSRKISRKRHMVRLHLVDAAWAESLQAGSLCVVLQAIFYKHLINGVIAFPC